MTDSAVASALKSSVRRASARSPRPRLTEPMVGRSSFSRTSRGERIRSSSEPRISATAPPRRRPPMMPSTALRATLDCTHRRAVRLGVEAGQVGVADDGGLLAELLAEPRRLGLELLHLTLELRALARRQQRGAAVVDAALRVVQALLVLGDLGGELRQALAERLEPDGDDVVERARACCRRTPARTRCEPAIASSAVDAVAVMSMNGLVATGASPRCRRRPGCSRPPSGWPAARSSSGSRRSRGRGRRPGPGSGCWSSASRPSRRRRWTSRCTSCRPPARSRRRRRWPAPRTRAPASASASGSRTASGGSPSNVPGSRRRGSSGPRHPAPAGAPPQRSAVKHGAS